MPRKLAAGRWSLFLLIILSCPLGGCGKSPGRQPAVGEIRLVSLSPALTDILFDLGLQGQIAGVSRYCETPPGFRRRVVGDMVSADTELLLSVKPSHLLFQGPRDHFANVARLDPSIRIEPFKMETIGDIAAAVERIGRLAGEPRKAREALSDFTGKIERARERVRGLKPATVLFVIDSRHQGFMAAGPDNFIDDLIALGGGINLGRFLPGSGRWRTAELEGLLAARPELIVVQVEPEDPQAIGKARAKWSRYIGQPGVELKRAEVVDDPRWTFPSTRVADLAWLMAGMIHPELN